MRTVHIQVGAAFLLASGLIVIIAYQFEVAEMDKKQQPKAAELRLLAEKKHGKKISETVWAWLDRREEINQALEDFEADPDQALKDFLEAVRSAEELTQRRGKTGGHLSQELLQRRAGGEIEDTITELEVERAKAIAEYLAKYASARKDVLNFRKEILENILLSAEDADTFVTSTMTCFASRSDFCHYGVPFIHHQAALVEQTFEENQTDWYHITRYKAEPSNSAVTQPFEKRFSFKERKRLDWIHENGALHQFYYCRGSLLDEIVTLAASLEHATGCNLQVAILFLLTGRALLIQPISIRLDMSNKQFGAYQQHQGSITMVIEPWVSPDSVMRTYRQLQQHIFGTSYKPMTSQRKLDLFRFVTEQMQIIADENKNENAPISRPEWPELLIRWNNLHPDLQYTRANIQRDYESAKQSILFPSYWRLK